MLDRRAEIVKTLRATPVVVRALVAGGRRRPAAAATGTWGVGDHRGCWAPGRHRGAGVGSGAAHASRGGPGAGTAQPLEPFDQKTLAEQRDYLGLELADELARLERLRAEHLALLVGLDGPSWERTCRHAEHGDMSLELSETHVAAEEVDHLAQIARLL